MKEKVWYIRHWFWLIFGLFLLWICISFLGEEFSWEICLVTLLPGLGSLFLWSIQPYLCSFDARGFTIHYPFGFWESGLWADVEAVCLSYERNGRGLGRTICVFYMKQDTLGKKTFYTRAQVPATRKTQMLIRKYWDPAFNTEPDIYNWRILFYVLVPLGFWGLYGWGIQGHGMLIISILLSLGGLFVTAISPWKFSFRKDKLRIHYFFGYFENIRWERIKHVQRSAGKGRHSLFPFVYHFTVNRGSTGKKCWFTTSDVNIGRAAKYWIQKYWQQSFEG